MQGVHPESSPAISVEEIIWNSYICKYYSSFMIINISCSVLCRVTFLWNKAELCSANSWEWPAYMYEYMFWVSSLTTFLWWNMYLVSFLHQTSNTAQQIFTSDNIYKIISTVLLLFLFMYARHTNLHTTLRYLNENKLSFDNETHFTL
jgi:hypothetical protein